MSVESYGSRAWEIDDHDANHLDSTTDTTPDSYEFSSFGGETGSKDAAEEEEKGVDQGLAKRAGKLKDKIEFGRFVYEWQGNQFLLYVAEYWIGSYDLVRHHYVLFPRSLESEEGREYVGKGSSEVVVDKLIAAAAKYGEKVEDEIWVYDRGYWGKSRRLWEGVRNCRWEDVVLDDGVKERVRGDVEGFFGRREEYNGLGVPWKVSLIFNYSLSLFVFLLLLPFLSFPSSCLILVLFAFFGGEVGFVLAKVENLWHWFMPLLLCHFLFLILSNT